jgi:RIP metalloprotease RseP
MEAVVGFVLGILAVVCAFGFIIFIHEMGHFLTARAVDIRCPQFAIGFGPSLFSFRWRGTNFAVRAFPLGGYVLMNGEEPGDRTEDPWAASVARYLGEEPFPASPAQLLETLDSVPEAERGEEWVDVRDQVAFTRCEEFPDLKSVEGNFHDRSVGARILVISGGVIMNFVATILLLWAMGPFTGVGSFFNDWSPVVSQAVPGAPAAEKGLGSGDLLLEVNGQPLETYLEAYHAIGAHPGTPFELKYRNRQKEEKVETIVPQLALGSEAYQVSDDGTLTLKQSSKQPELVDKVVASVKRDELVRVSREKIGREKESYEILFQGDDEPVTFELPKDFAGPRGQIGVRFGVSDIRFERELSGAIVFVEEGSLAETAGLRVGDELLVAGELPLVSNSGQVFGSLANPALESVSEIEQIKEIEFVVKRGEELEVLRLPKPEQVLTLETLGVRLRPIDNFDLIKAPFSMIGQMLVSPYMILKGWLTAEYSGSEIVQNLQGPIGIMQILYQISDNGIAQFIFFVALLNAAIGAFNLLPFPALDGSRLVFLLIAGVRGKPVDPDKEAKIHLAGLMLLLSFVLFVSFGDIKRLISSHLFVL